ncbi:MAG: glucose-1-phosphate cytidylyltransferase [Dehalococcoidia bacterium]|nr:glucose-1-phosphate cytidylyltransferase [Dehalococcoidia bacterium]
MPVVILCGGMGTRLREETEFRPKPMLEIGGRPMLWHIMKIYAHYGFKDFILCLGYKGDIIREFFLNYRAMNNDFVVEPGLEKVTILGNDCQELDWRVTLAETGAVNMTGSRLKQVQKYVGNRTFMLTYGDGVGDIDIRALLDFHRHHSRIGTVTGVTPGTARFGEIVGDRGVVVSFAEKPPISAIVNGGFFVFEPDFFNYIPVEPDCILERDPLERLAADRELMVYQHGGFWQCMDTPRDMDALNQLWNQRKASWAFWQAERNGLEIDGGNNR